MGWELQQLPARVMFRLDGFPGIIIVLSKQESWEGRPGLPLIGDVALEAAPSLLCPRPRASARCPPAAPCPEAFGLSCTRPPHPTSPIVNVMGISCD